MAALSTLVSDTSPTKTSTTAGMNSMSRSERTTALTVYPRSRSLRTSTRPTRPAAPMTSTVVKRALGVSYSVNDAPERRSASYTSSSNVASSKDGNDRWIDVIEVSCLKNPSNTWRDLRPISSGLISSNLKSFFSLEPAAAFTAAARLRRTVPRSSSSSASIADASSPLSSPLSLTVVTVALLLSSRSPSPEVAATIPVRRRDREGDIIVARRGWRFNASGPPLSQFTRSRPLMDALAVGAPLRRFPPARE
mmetsp:Transcript_21590/g.34964  ORF Transcript_21590/g.34964 Transcript_21590/m.34964 type:complete len:251 (-) Transcript_21590:139-891(-)